MLKRTNNQKKKRKKGIKINKVVQNQNNKSNKNEIIKKQNNTKLQ